MNKMTGSKAIMEAFRREGVEYVFGLPGSTELFFLSAFIVFNFSFGNTFFPLDA